MKIKLSKSMQSCIKETQEYAEKVYKDLKHSEVLKVIKKPTQKKVFEFHIINIGKPVLRIIVNKKFYKEFMKFGKSWKEI